MFKLTRTFPPAKWCASEIHFLLLSQYRTPFFVFFASKWMCLCWCALHFRRNFSGSSKILSGSMKLHECVWERRFRVNFILSLSILPVILETDCIKRKQFDLIHLIYVYMCNVYGIDIENVMHQTHTHTQHIIRNVNRCENRFNLQMTFKWKIRKLQQFSRYLLEILGNLDHSHINNK